MSFAAEDLVDHIGTLDLSPAARRTAYHIDRLPALAVARPFWAPIKIVPSSSLHLCALSSPGLVFESSSIVPSSSEPLAVLSNLLLELHTFKDRPISDWRQIT